MPYRTDAEHADEPAMIDDDAVAPFVVWTLGDLEGSPELDSLRAAWTDEYDT